ncbi:L-threonylcarbamoyladenylate synthase [Natrarchaeobaculum sulfurireducens]|uniref:L-threonylcarbamoyladenylate synthase n=1 Tax=Natrarchaeobaculum sulfurireducens TaxID=2044521 RepID=A0A346PAL3_9EURY|nr:L-threonylcarbamoyladenylate synthase [Natrarchaeobaculum sulfurireducens]AXR76558.1 tRNA A37 threonylcarbamoyladenosine synthetase subunit TsaC/SUA5/YrdC [Natrarchaeobaculum sulfurireducens]
MDEDELERVATAIRNGELVVYPTETVYGLGADALDPDAVERVFDAKGRDRDKPISFAVPTFETAVEAGYVEASDRERAFADDFLPGPVTVLCARRELIPDVLTAGRDRVGVRVPDCEPALELCTRAGRPITATSANESGQPSARRVEEVSERVRDAAVVLDGGETPGTESTVVDVSSGTIHRRGALADEIEAWLESE